MQVLQIQDAFGLDNLAFAERPDPTPGVGEVVVRIKAISLNFRDLLTVTGLYGANYALPLVPFSDGAGEIVAVGEGVTRFKIGDRVTSLFFSSSWIGGPPSFEKLRGSLGGPHDGCGQQFLKISEHGVIATPDHLSDAEAACLPCAAVTAWRALVVDGEVCAGDTVVLQGTGGVSIFGLQLAKAMGLRTIITSSSNEKLERAKALGADVGVNYAERPDWSAVVREVTGGRGADVILEVGGAKTLMESLKAVRLGGHVAIIGVLSGVAEPLPIPLLIWSNARVQGLSVGSRENFEAMNRALSLHKIRPVISKVFSWREAKAALIAMQKGEHFGKIVLSVD